MPKIATILLEPNLKKEEKISLRVSVKLKIRKSIATNFSSLFLDHPNTLEQSHHILPIAFKSLKFYLTNIGQLI